MRFAVIDDNIKELKLISSLLKKEFNNYPISYSLDNYYNPMSLNFNNYYNILFLDIDMPKDGIELAREYLSTHKTTIIIFISNRTERVFDTFDVHPYQFIRKCNLEETTKQLIPALIDKIGLYNNYITIKTTLGLIDLPLNKIKYIKSDKHYCYFVTSLRIYKSRNILSNITNLLSKDFCRICNTLIINWQYVEEFNNKIVKIDKEYFSVTKPYITKSKQAYRAYIESAI